MDTARNDFNGHPYYMALSEHTTLRDVAIDFLGVTHSELKMVDIVVEEAFRDGGNARNASGILENQF